MARIYPMFSSSKGNCCFFGTPEGGILIDCGVSCKRICEGLAANMLPLSAIKAVFITHTHSDHVAGLKVFMKKVHAPVYAQQKNLDILRRRDMLSGAFAHPIDDGLPVKIGGFEVTHFPTPHDTPASCGYRVRFPDGKTAALCTDSGHITEDIRSGISGAELVMLESNYDPDMLRNGSYSYELQERIRSDRGHLSNVSCGEMLKELAEGGTRNFVLAHISPENNTPETAVRAAIEALSPLECMKDYLLYAAPMEGGGAIAF